MVKEIILQKIKQELSTDPDGLGYTTKTNDEIVTMLNNSVKKQRTIIEEYPSPINRILSGIADTPNIVGLQDIIDAKVIA